MIKAKSLQSCLTLQPNRRQPTRLPRPWDSPGKNTGVDCQYVMIRKKKVLKRLQKKKDVLTQKVSVLLILTISNCLLLGVWPGLGISPWTSTGWPESFYARICLMFVLVNVRISRRVCILGNRIKEIYCFCNIVLQKVKLDKIFLEYVKNRMRKVVKSMSEKLRNCSNLYFSKPVFLRYN